MRIQRVQNNDYNTNFGIVKEITYPRKYWVIMRNNLHPQSSVTMIEDMDSVAEFNKRISALQGMKTRIKGLLDYNDLLGMNRKYADALLGKISDKEKKNLTIKIDMDNNDFPFDSLNCSGHLRIDFPELYTGWNKIHGVEVTRFYGDYHTNGDWHLDDDNLIFFFGRLPMPTPKFVKEQVKKCLLKIGKDLYIADKANKKEKCLKNCVD